MRLLRGLAFVLAATLFGVALAAPASAQRMPDETPPGGMCNVPGIPPPPVSDGATPADIVNVGVYINDINAIDLRNHTFSADIYIWFRWKDKRYLRPGNTFEFMNLGDLEHQRCTEIYTDLTDQPDGSAYQLFRYQGDFSTKFPVHRYPFDRQSLRMEFEDQSLGSTQLRYAVDELQINPDIVLPGYEIGAARMRITDHPYPTTFGDRNQTETIPYSHALITVDVSRPWLSGALKTMMPVLLIILCSAIALLLDEQQLDARIGLTITSLLALVALQFSMLGSLPEVGYLLMLDQIYIASYLFVLGVIAVVVSEKRIADQDPARAAKIRGQSVRTTVISVGVYVLVTALIVFLNLAVFQPT